MPSNSANSSWSSLMNGRGYETPGTDFSSMNLPMIVQQVDNESEDASDVDDDNGDDDEGNDGDDGDDGYKRELARAHDGLPTAYVVMAENRESENEGEELLKEVDKALSEFNLSMQHEHAALGDWPEGFGTMPDRPHERNHAYVPPWEYQSKFGPFGALHASSLPPPVYIYHGYPSIWMPNPQSPVVSSEEPDPANAYQSNFYGDPQGFEAHPYAHLPLDRETPITCPPWLQAQLNAERQYGYYSWETLVSNAVDRLVDYIQKV